GSTQSDLLIFTTTIPTNHKITTLLQDRQYRLAIAWQNTAYNQPPHLSYSPEDTFDESASIMLMSGALNQAIALNDPMEPVSLMGRNCEGLTCGDLPAGLTWKYDADTKTGTISGTPTEEGDYGIVVTTTGAVDGGDVSVVVKLIVKRNNTLTPVAYYSFDAPGQTLANHIAGAPDATLTGNAAPAAVDGKKGNAALFDGSHYYVQSAYDNIQLGQKDFTIEFWMQSTDDAAYIIHKGSHAANAATGTTGKWIGLELKNGALSFAIDDDITKTEAKLASATSYFDGEWHHVVMVRDAFKKQLMLYLDGKEVARADDKTGDISDNNENFIIGNVNVNFDNSFKGALDELYIYHGVMSPEKVAERYQTTGLDLAYFPFDQVGETTPNMVYGEAVAMEGTPTAVEGIKGGAVRFENGAYYRQEAYDAIQLGESSFSIELWINSTDADGYIFFKGSHSANAATGTTGNWIGLERKNNYLSFAIDDDVTKLDCQLVDANYVFDGNWHHVVCVRDYPNQMCLLYVDGVEVARKTDVKTLGINDNNEPLLIGISDETARPYEGLIDELTIRPVVMTPEEILAAYQAVQSGVEAIDTDNANTLYTVVDIYSGAIVRQAYGNGGHEIMNQVAPGVYVLVVDKGANRDVYKFIRR
ncbi:MAG: putative Ig domain-containing protein, partial [Muribaculaceae bacterium]|nr:putative Ig domain-containing protein [Muribaculaceae bacterium]